MKKLIILFLSVFFLYSFTSAFSFEDFQKYLNEDETRAEEMMKQLIYRKIRYFKGTAKTNKKLHILETLKDKNFSKNIKKYKQRKKDILVLKTYLLENYPSLNPRKTSKNDDSITKYVWPKNFYTSKLYIPSTLEKISTEYYLITTNPSTRIRKEAYKPLKSMAKKYYHKFSESLHINSAWRPYFVQRNSFDQECFDEKICARPGTSEHQNGYTVDIANLHGDKYQRMKENAHHYGFHQSYQKESDGLQIEPRHRRYLWVWLATYLHEENITFTDYWRENNDEKN